ncbi:alpha/beta hydrolase [Ancylothrix sp. C2]|uniref:alpha/beta fold hydrolase n=1 Tax=Ancylothrix sp. D3o TaxID=2953691 RepID=UPI0021BB1293|nr:alpha/beta hydrolase [Ancylothrix sp. D3o]MCT7951956.1 alpha/beta hydrolase [Ancylothrix sp. D3o]
MQFIPLIFPLVWLTGLLSLAVLGGGIYIVYKWYSGELDGYGYLVAGLLMILWSVAGRFFSLPLLRRWGVNEPKPMRTGTVRRIARPDGSELHIELYGPEDGQPLILIHGWGPNSTVWYYAKRQLSDRYRVIVWDLPGLGKSKRPKNNDYSLEKYAGDLEAVLGLTGDKPAIVLGHSMGGMIALTFCRLFPQYLGTKLAKLILVDTSYINPVKTSILSGLLQVLQKPVLEPMLYLTIFLSPLLWLLTWLSYFNGSLYLTVELSGYTGKETRGQLDFSAYLSALGEPGVLARGTLAMLKLEESATLKAINIPVLLVTGASDIAIVPETSWRMKALLPQAEIVTLKPGGHMALMELNEEFSRAVSGFIEG